LTDPHDPHYSALMQNGCLNRPAVKRFEFRKSKMADSCHLKKTLGGRDILAAVRSILTKFGIMMQNRSSYPAGRQRFQYSKLKMADGGHFEKPLKCVISSIN